jgi:tRNA nucleotidyltransferase/poly(A) polymerase
MARLAAHKQLEFALEVVRALRGAGFIAYWAGGCVRDKLLGTSPKDYDVATDARPEAIRDLFGRRRTIPVGAAFGVIAVVGPKTAGTVEIATFRNDAQYSDGRHPDHVTFSTPEEDAQRRDFTINGLFFDPMADEVIDFVGGQADLSAGVIRAIGDAERRIAEDKLRMLRAIRFAAALDFSIERTTFAAVQEMAPQIQLVSAERIGAELQSMLLGPRRARAFGLLRESALLAEVLPELAALPDEDRQDERWTRTLHVLAAFEEPTLPLALAGALHQAGEGAMARDLGRRLRYPNKTIDRAAWLLDHWRAVAQADALPWPRLQRVLIHDGAAELVDLGTAIDSPASPAIALCRGKLALPSDELNPAPLITGDDLVAHGIAPGALFRSLLEQVRDAQLEGRIHDSDEALKLAGRLRDAEDA